MALLDSNTKFTNNTASVHIPMNI